MLCAAYRTTRSPVSISLSQLIGIQEGYLSLLQDSGELREDLKLPEGDLGKEIESRHEGGEEILVGTVTLVATLFRCSFLSKETFPIPQPLSLLLDHRFKCDG